MRCRLKGREGEGERVWFGEGRGSDKHRGSWEGASDSGRGSTENRSEGSDGDRPETSVAQGQRLRQPLLKPASVRNI